MFTNGHPSHKCKNEATLLMDHQHVLILELKQRLSESKDTYRKKLEEKLGRNRAKYVLNVQRMMSSRGEHTESKRVEPVF